MKGLTYITTFFHQDEYQYLIRIMGPRIYFMIYLKDITNIDKLCD